MVSCQQKPYDLFYFSSANLVGISLPIMYHCIFTCNVLVALKQQLSAVVVLTTLYYFVVLLDHHHLVPERVYIYLKMLFSFHLLLLAKVVWQELRSAMTQRTAI